MVQQVKNPRAMQESWVRSLGWEDSPGEGKGYPLQYSGLENSMRSQSWTQLSHFHFHIYICVKKRIGVSPNEMDEPRAYYTK